MSSFLILGLWKSTSYLAHFCHPEMNCFVLSASLRIPSCQFKQKSNISLRNSNNYYFHFFEPISTWKVTLAIFWLQKIQTWTYWNCWTNRAIQLQYNGIWDIFICTIFWDDILWTNNAYACLQTCCNSALIRCKLFTIINHWQGTRKY